MQHSGSADSQSHSRASQDDRAAVSAPVKARHGWGVRGLVGQVVRATGIDIVSGRLKPGQILPNEARWAEQLGVSRTVLREAVKVLISKGLVSSRPRIGTKVQQPEAWNVLDQDVLDWQIEAAPREGVVRDLFEFRRILEPALAARAAERASAEDLAGLETAFRAMEGASDEPESFIGPDCDFHQRILRAVESPMVRALGRLIEAALTASLHLTLDAPQGQKSSLPLHKAVFEAIHAREPAAAAIAMRSLIDDAERDALRALATGPAAAGKERAA